MILIHQIVERAGEMAKQSGAPIDFLRMNMDLMATHANGCPLRLSELLAAPDDQFAHDVFGIARYIDRDTGMLDDCFVPRYAAA